MQVMEERLTREKICSLRCLEDIVHAFGSVDKELQIAMNEQVARRDFANLTLQRIDYSCFMLRIFDGEVCLLPQQGVLAGDLFVCKRCFATIAAGWWRSWKRKSLILWNTFSGLGRRTGYERIARSVCVRTQMILQSFCCWADRSIRTQKDGRSAVYRIAMSKLPQFETQQQLVNTAKGKYNHYEKCLSTAFWKHKMVMSATKQVCQPLFVGTHAHRATRQLSLEGMDHTEVNSVKLTARYLGPSLKIGSSNTIESKARRKATQAAVKRYQGLCSAEVFPTIRRLLFRSHVLSKSLSANEAFVWSKGEIANIDKFISAAARN